uniref:Heme maturaase n=1 Tax=Thuricola similis TaxID=2784598 RepID=A0A7T8JKB4_9CILI|nr:Heme maturaase [Thuricola similis]QQP22152.1 Heme maturaase [Thuricola similis]
MWEFFLIFFNYNVLILFDIVSLHIIKIILIFFNHLYFSLFFLSLLVFVKHTYTNFWFLLIIFFFYKIYFLELQNYILLKYLYSTQLNHHFAFELLVGLVSIHPPLFYLGISCWVNFFTWSIKKNKIFKFKLVIGMLILISALFLGGVWGWLNFTWGFLWVYDYIEFFLLWLTLTNIYWIHVKCYKKFIFTNIWFLGILLLFYISLRYSFLPTRHSFFSKLSSNIFKLYLSLILCINFFNSCMLTIYLIIFFNIKFLSFFFSYAVVVILVINVKKILYIYSKNYLITHLIVIYYIFIFFFKLTNYYFLLMYVETIYFNFKIWLNSTYCSCNTFIQQINKNKIILKIFKNNIFLEHYDTVKQTIVKTQSYNQVNNDFYLFLLILILFFIKQW